MERNAKAGSRIKRTLVLVVVVLSLGGIGYFLQARNVFERGTRSGDTYQAVFLDNGQVYFGKVRDKESTYVKLTDVYYLQRTEPLQGEPFDPVPFDAASRDSPMMRSGQAARDRQGKQDRGGVATSSQSDVTLRKLGSELHGPRDEMEILRDHIVFIETLQGDSKVVQAIMEHENEEG